MSKLSIQTKIGFGLLMAQFVIAALLFIFGMPLAVGAIAPQFKDMLDAMGVFTWWPYFATFAVSWPIYLWVKGVLTEEKKYIKER